MTTQIDSQIQDLSRKLAKSQSVELIDQRAEECIKVVARSPTQTVSKTIRKRLPKLILSSPRNQDQLIAYYVRFLAIVGQYYAEVVTETVKSVD